MHSIHSSVAPLSLLLLSLTASAHEGMWTPEQLPQIASDLKKAGLALEPASLTRLTDFPMGAIVSLGGCSASFVSPQGLVITNHHCAYGSLQYNSTPARNLLRDGFLAKTSAEELPAAPGSRVYVTVEVINVTDRVIDANTAKLTGKPRIDAMEANEKALVAACERDTVHRCRLSGFYGGLTYQLIKQLEIRDVRLAYAPPEGVGKFGGNTDNWMWPRHTGDFSFLRAYVGKDGKPADFNPDNVPYRPAHHLKLARQGLSEGDFVMVAGYPGRTSRYRLPGEVEFTFGWQYPKNIELAKQRLDIIARETKERPAAALAYAGTVAGINNGYKKSQGLLDAYFPDSRAQQVPALLQRRRAQFAAIDTRALELLLAARNDIAKRDVLLEPSTPRLLSAARTLYKLANEKAKANDLDRKLGYQQRDWPRIEQELSAIDKRYDERVDRALVHHFLKKYLRLPGQQQNSAFKRALGIDGQTTDTQLSARLDALYAGSRLGDQATRLAWLNRAPAAFQSSTDTFIKAAVALYADDEAREAADKELQGRIQQAYRDTMKALIAHKTKQGEAIYPDANGTLRISYGNVASRAPRSAHDGMPDGTAWTAFTTLRGIVDKHTGTGEFDAPDAQLAAIQARNFGPPTTPYSMAALDSVPVNFLATLDITGGNSGSAILNHRAELVGLAFDGTLDSVISDWDFNPLTTRTIGVDLRYVLWQMRVVDHADRLLDEMQAP